MYVVLCYLIFIFQTSARLRKSTFAKRVQPSGNICRYFLGKLANKLNIKLIYLWTGSKAKTRKIIWPKAKFILYFCNLNEIYETQKIHVFHIQSTFFDVTFLYENA